MTVSSWHVPADVWSAYSEGRSSSALDASVEAHVVGCATCRAAARAYAPVDPGVVFRAVQAVVTRPRVPLALRWLRRLGVPEHELVLLGAADAVMLPWVTAVAAALVCALVSGLSGDRLEPAFLGLAPLVPVLSVVAAFEATEQLREVSAPTPYSALRLALVRVSAALTVALPLTAAVGLLVPGLGDLAFSWLLPGLGLSAGALVLLTWLPVRVVALVLPLAWGAGVVATASAGRVQVLAATGPQLTFAVAAALLALLFGARTTTGAAR